MTFVLWCAFVVATVTATNHNIESRRQQAEVETGQTCGYVDISPRVAPDDRFRPPVGGLTLDELRGLLRPGEQLVEGHRLIDPGELVCVTDPARLGELRERVP